MLILNDGQVEHADHSCIAVAQHFNIWDFGTWLLSLLEDLCDTGEVGCGTRLIYSRLEYLSCGGDEFVCFRVQGFLSLSEKGELAQNFGLFCSVFSWFAIDGRYPVYHK